MDAALKSRTALLCFPPNPTPDEVERVAKTLIAYGRETLGCLFVCEDTQTAYDKTFAQYGDYPSWIQALVTGRNYTSGRPRFDVIVVTRSVFGRGTAGIVELALSIRRPVFFVTDTTINVVTSLVTIDDKNWQEGWSVTTRGTC